MIGSSRKVVASLGIACVALLTLGASTGVAATSGAPSTTSRSVIAPEILSATVAQQLGVKLAPAQPEELSVGASITGSLEDPTKLAAFGLRDAQPGARVTILRTGQERVRVDIDELDPTPRSRILKLKLDADGKLGTLGS